jgi:hypothetical protein
VTAIRISVRSLGLCPEVERLNSRSSAMHASNALVLLSNVTRYESPISLIRFPP